MRIYFWTAGIIFAGVAVGAELSKHYGWYNDYWFTDAILHTISGTALGIFWLGVARRKIRSNFVMYLGLVSFAVFASAVWEVWELIGWRWFPELFEHYEMEVWDTLSDLVYGLLGASFVSIMQIKRNNVS